jgi:[ribosomal protein S5]-alanine N-acetyltransferase
VPRSPFHPVWDARGSEHWSSVGGKPCLPASESVSTTGPPAGATGHIGLRREEGALSQKAMPTIDTERCLCAPLAESDFPSVAKLFANHQVRRFLGGVKDFSQDHFAFLCSCPLIWAVSVNETGEFIGLIFIGRHHDGEEMEVSFQFLPESWGKGLASETVGAIVDYARDNLNLKRIVAETQTANNRSKTLLERLGMRPVRWLTRFGEEQVLYELIFEF